MKVKQTGKMIYGSFNHALFLKYSIFVVIFLSNVKPHLNQDLKQKDTSQDDINVQKFSNAKKEILKWWKGNNEKSHKKCRINNAVDTNSHSDIEKLVVNVPEIISFPCNNSFNFRPFYFTGEFQDNRLEGKGKLVFLNATILKKLSKEKQKKIQEKRTCFKIDDGQTKRDIVEIIGTFSNGSLNGRSKLTYMDGSYSVSNYKKGKRNGYHLLFDSKGDLVEAGLYANAFEIGYHWRKGLDHLIYQDRNIIKSNHKKSLVFPLLDDGSLGHPILGDYYHYSGVLENVYNIKYIEVISKKSDCGLNLDYQVRSKANYSYSLRTREKISKVHGS